MVFLNCGSRLDLTEQWFTHIDSEILALMLDSHRPIHHKNVHAGQKLIVVADPDSLKDCPTIEEVQVLETLTEDEEEVEALFDEEDNKENRQSEVPELADEDEDEEDIQRHIGKKRALKIHNQKKQRLIERKEKSRP